MVTGSGYRGGSRIFAAADRRCVHMQTAVPPPLLSYDAFILIIRLTKVGTISGCSAITKEPGENPG